MEGALSPLLPLLIACKGNHYFQTAKGLIKKELKASALSPFWFVGFMRYSVFRELGHKL